jgi:hypothetical protein
MLPLMSVGPAALRLGDIAGSAIFHYSPFPSAGRLAGGAFIERDLGKSIPVDVTKDTQYFVVSFKNPESDKRARSTSPDGDKQPAPLHKRRCTRAFSPDAIDLEPTPPHDNDKQPGPSRGRHTRTRAFSPDAIDLEPTPPPAIVVPWDTPSGSEKKPIEI